MATIPQLPDTPSTRLAHEITAAVKTWCESTGMYVRKLTIEKTSLTDATYVVRIKEASPQSIIDELSKHVNERTQAMVGAMLGGMTGKDGDDETEM